MDKLEEYVWRFWVRLGLLLAPLALAGLAALFFAVASAAGRTIA